MPSDPYYKSQHWKKLRARRLATDGYRCIVPGCGQRATTVDHIKRRRDSGADTLENTRSLCDEHERSIKEMSDGRRRNGGKLVVKGCFADGSPRDPNHPWYTGGPKQRAAPPSLAVHPPVGHPWLTGGR